MSFLQYISKFKDSEAEQKVEEYEKDVRQGYKEPIELTPQDVHKLRVAGYKQTLVKLLNEGIIDDTVFPMRVWGSELVNDAHGILFKTLMDLYPEIIYDTDDSGRNMLFYLVGYNMLDAAKLLVSAQDLITKILVEFIRVQEIKNETAEWILANYKEEEVSFTGGRRRRSRRRLRR